MEWSGVWWGWVGWWAGVLLRIYFSAADLKVSPRPELTSKHIWLAARATAPTHVRSHGSWRGGVRPLAGSRRTKRRATTD